MPKLLPVALIAVLLQSSLAKPQGETTSAIAGEVKDETGGSVKARVSVTNKDTGLKRSVQTDNAGRFQFPQLIPGIYAVQVEAPGFDAQNDNVAAALGRTQTVNFVLKIGTSRQTVTVTEASALVDTENPNTATSLNAKALENLPNPGSDLTYPLQFAAGAVMNTAGSGNDFVGGSNGYGNVEFNGLPALANGYIVDGLESNDPLTNLNAAWQPT